MYIHGIKVEEPMNKGREGSRDLPEIKKVRLLVIERLPHCVEGIVGRLWLLLLFPFRYLFLGKIEL